MPQFRLQDYANAWNTHNVDKVVEFYAEDAELVDAATGQTQRGKEEIRRNVQSFLKAFPDVNGAAATVVESSNKFAAVYHVSGKHSGPWALGGREIPATNKKADYKLGVFIETDGNGKIKREIDIADTATIIQQLGISPESVIRAGTGAQMRPSK